MEGLLKVLILVKKREYREPLSEADTKIAFHGEIFSPSNLVSAILKFRKNVFLSNESCPFLSFPVINCLTKKPQSDDFRGVCLDYLNCLLIQSANNHDKKGNPMRSFK